MKRLLPLLLCLSAACSVPEAAPAREWSAARADAEFLLGSFSGAAHLYEQALAGAPEARRAEVLAQIGKCRLGAGDPEGAIRAFGEALAAGPAAELRAEIHYRRAAAHNSRWEPVEALADLGRAREACAGAVKAEEFAYRLAVTTLRAGDWKGGRALLGEVASRWPRSREAADAKDRLALDAFRIQVARVRQPKGDTTPSAAGDHLVLVGRFTRFPEAVREMERMRRAGQPDAFVIP